MLQVIESIHNNDREGMLKFIRKELAFPVSLLQSLKESREIVEQEHYRFDMSGYDFNGTGSVTIHNQTILNKFAKYGIYDHHEFIALDFYKGAVTFYEKTFTHGSKMKQHDFTGMTTSEIILEIFNLTVLSGLPKRRRD